MQKIDGCHISTATPIESMMDNVMFNVGKHKNVYHLDEWRATKEIALVGGGPSLADQLDALAQFNLVMVCGSAHDFLVENNIKFEYCIVCDPDPLVLNYIKYPQRDVKYLIATQCDPSVFEKLKDYQVFAWNASIGDKDHHINFTYPTVGGGCTVGTRAIIMAMAFGFYDLHLFGYDTCLGDNYEHHAYKFSDPEKETIGDITEIQLDGPIGKKYKLAGYMLGQFFDFQAILKEHYAKLNITVHGEGLLRDLMRISLKKAANLTEKTNES